MLRLASIVAPALLLACATSPAAPPPGDVDAGSTAAALTQPVERLAALSRGPCFGRCPEYTVEVFTDGLVRYEGVRNVAVVGAATAHLDAEHLATLTRRLERDFPIVASQRENRLVPDLPVLRLTFRGQELRHSVGAFDTPALLSHLEDDFEALVGTARWVTSPER